MAHERTVDYLIIGGGLAGATAVKTLRERDATGTILLVTGESFLPYHRPPLSKEYLRGEINAEGTYGGGGVFVEQPDWYAAQNVEVLRAVTAEALDTRARTVSLADGQTVHFTTLLLATGARARTLAVPGADLPGVMTLRTLDDADALRERLQPGQRLVVVGSGFIGMETAASALQQGLAVTVVAPEPRPWPTMMPDNVAAFFAQYFQARGADLRYGHTAAEFVAGPDGRVASVRVAPVGGGAAVDVPCDLVIVGVGVQLNSEIAGTAGLATDPRHGIVVDERLETDAAGIFAAGDVAGFPSLLGDRMHFEHWDNAIASAEVAAANMSGGDAPFRHVPYFFSDQFDLAVNMLGFPTPEAQVVVRGDLAAAKFTALYVRDGALRAALLVNDDAQMDLLRELIAAGAPVSDAARLSDPTFDLATLRPS